MEPYNATVDEVIAKRLSKTREGIHSLQDWLKSMDKELETIIKYRPGQAFSAHWATVIMKKAIEINNEIIMCNGASLARRKGEDGESEAVSIPRIQPT